MKVNLNPAEREVLFRQRPGRSGGFQCLMLKLQSNITANGDLHLDDDDLERIPRYAFDYGGGGWEDRMKAIFERHLSPDLGRSKLKPLMEQVSLL